MSRSLQIDIEKQDKNDDPIAPSLNEFFGSMNRYARAKKVKAWKYRILEALDGNVPKIPEDWYPIDVEMRCYFGPGDTRYDAANLASTWKVVEDGLRAAGVLENDSPRYVNPLTMISLKGDRRRTVIVISPGNLPRDGKLD